MLNRFSCFRGEVSFARNEAVVADAVLFSQSAASFALSSNEEWTISGLSKLSPDNREAIVGF